MSLTEEEKKELEMRRNRKASMEAIVSEMDNVDSSTEADTKQEIASKFPGGLAGGTAAAKMVPPLGNPLLTFLGKGIAGVGGALAGSEITGPYVKPYTDKIHDAFTDPRNKQVIALGDDFNQGQPLMGMPSVIDNSVVPYETVDSSSTGVLRNVPQL